VNPAVIVGICGVSLPLLIAAILFVARMTAKVDHHSSILELVDKRLTKVESNDEKHDVALTFISVQLAKLGESSEWIKQALVNITDNANRREH